MVRLDQYGKKGNVEGSFLFDLAGNEVKFLNPKRKLWGLQKSETPQVIRGTCQVTKGTATKTIANVKCTEYTVKNTDENTVITYWIAEGKYPFFAPLVKTPGTGKTNKAFTLAKLKVYQRAACLC